MKKKFTPLLLLLLLCSSDIYGQSNVSALLADTMRQYQARYRVLNNGDEYIWPDVFNCRFTGMPAPANPSDSYFSEEVNDPERLAELAEGLRNEVSNYYFLRNFVTNYDELKAGKSSNGPGTGGRLEIHEITEIDAKNAISALTKIRQTLVKLNYILLYGMVSNEKIKIGAGYGRGRICNQAAALNATCLDPYSGETIDFSDWQNGWLTYQFRTPHSYLEGDVVYNQCDVVNEDGECLVTDTKIGFHEYASNGIGYDVCIYDSTLGGIFGGSIIRECLPHYNFSKITIVKGEIVVRPLRDPLDLSVTKGEVELFLKLDDLGTMPKDATSEKLGMPGLRNPPVKADNLFKFFSSKSTDEVYGNGSLIWHINEKYDENYVPSFESPAFETGRYYNGWELLDYGAVLKPKIIEKVDEGISCQCAPCNDGSCPPGTPNYSNSSIMISFPLGFGGNNRSAGYLMIHEDRPNDLLKTSAALRKYLAEGTGFAPNQLKVVAPNVVVFIRDDPDGVDSTYDWSLEFYHKPYVEGNAAYHTVTFEAIYDGDDFDRFTVTESGDLGNRLREYVWKSETVSGRSAQLNAIVEGGSVTGFEIIDSGSRYFDLPGITLSGGDGSGASISAEVTKGVITEIELIEGGGGYDESTVISINEKNNGSGARVIPIIENGRIVRMIIESGGSGYTDQAEVVFSGGGGSGARARVRVSDAVLSNFKIKDEGSGYTSAPTVTIDAPDPDNRTGWELVYYDTDNETPIKREYKREGIGDDGHPAEIVTIYDGDGTPLKETTTSYFEKSYGRHPRQIVELILNESGTETGKVITNFRYYENTNDSSYGLLAKKWQNNNGPWQRFTYYPDGRLQRRVEQYLSSSINQSDDDSAYTDYVYTVEDLNGDKNDEIIAMTSRGVLGNVISRQFEIWWGGMSAGNVISRDETYNYRERWIVQALNLTIDTPSEAIGSVDTLTSKYRYYVYETGQQYGIHDGKLRSEETPDGNISIFEYTGSDTLEYSGARSTGTSQDVGKGILYRTMRNEYGNVILETVRSYPDDLLLSKREVAGTDAYGRVTSWNFSRGTGGAGKLLNVTYATTNLNYNCCGLASETDMAGILTTYLYDGLKRVKETTRGGISTVNTLDALGRIRSTKENDLLTRKADYNSLGLIIKEETLFKDSLVVTTRSMNRTNPDFDIETVNFPDSSNVTIYYHKDGTLYQRIGSATLPVRYKYDSSNLGRRITTEIKLKKSGNNYVNSGEYRRTITDMAGRILREEWPNPSGEGIARQIYNYNERGQLEWIEDADGVRTYQAYNSYAEPSGSYINDNKTGVLNSTKEDFVYSGEEQKVYHRVTSLVGSDTSDQSVAKRTPDGLFSIVTQYGLKTNSITELKGSNYSRKITTTYPDETYNVQLYNHKGLLKQEELYSSSNAILLRTTYKYDNRNRLEVSNDLRNGATTFTYYADGRLKSMTGPDPVKMQSGVGLDAQVIQYDYAFESNGGIRTTVTLPDETTQTTVNNSLGQLVLAYGSQINPAAYSYDFAGRPMTSTTWQDFNPDNELESPGGVVTQWLYNKSGLLEEKRFDVVSSDDFEPGPKYKYTDAGRLKSRILARDVTSIYKYNKEGLLWQVDHGDDGIIDKEVLYDTAGRPTSITDVSGTRSLSYQYGQPDNESYGAGVFNGYVIDRKFDTKGRYQGVTLRKDNDALHSYTYDYNDATGRLQAVSSAVYHFSYSYYANSSLPNETVFTKSESEVLRHRREWDFLNRLKSIENLNASSVIFNSFAYRYNNLNQRERMTLADGNYWEYKYDNLGQVEHAVYKDASDVAFPGRDFGFTFDDIGNRIQTDSNGRIANYTPNNLNQYERRQVPRALDVSGSAHADSTVTVNGAATTRRGEYFYYELDQSANGNGAQQIIILATATLPDGGDNDAPRVAEVEKSEYLPPNPESFKYDLDGNLEQDSRWFYKWDAENRLVEMKTRPIALNAGVSRQKLEFIYDSQGRRFSKKVYDWDNGPSSYVLTSEFLYFYDGWNLIAEFKSLQTSNFELHTSYVWGADISGTMQGAGGVGGLLMVTDAEGLTYYPSFDGNSNVMGYYAADTGESVAEFEYGPFGELIRATGEKKDAFNFRFSTKYEDAETGLLYYGYRYYNAETGRWLNRDPIGEHGGLNLYCMVGNNPINLGDLLGLLELEFNAFIPGSLGKRLTGTVEGQGRNVSGTWLPEPDPTSPWWFGTDNREFGGGNARLWSRSREIKVSELGNMEGAGKPFRSASDLSKRIRKKPILGNIQSPNPILEFQQDNAHSTQTVKVKDEGACTTKITVRAAGSYPFIDVAPDIDYEVTWTLKRVDKNKIEITIEGWHNGFPNYEGLVDGKNIYEGPTLGTGPNLWNLGWQKTKFKRGPQTYSE